MDANDSFCDFRNKLANSDEAAAEQILRRYAQPLVGKAKQYLDPTVRAKVDAEDIVQSALGSFFRRNQTNDLALDNWASLWGLLLTITIRKCHRKSTYYHAARRDVSREHQTVVENGEPVAQQIVSLEPSAEEVLQAAELIDELMAQLELSSHRNILALSLQGYTASEVSQHVRRSQRTVFRVLEEVRHRLECQIDG